MDTEVGNNEYLNKLTIRHATKRDSGLYICFVTNSGFGNMTYKSMTLTVGSKDEFHNVIKNVINNSEDNKKKSSGDSGVTNTNGNNKTDIGNEPTAVLVVVICLCVAVGILLVVILSYVICKRRSKDSTVDTRSNSTSSSASDVERPFVRPPQPIKPLPPTPKMWTHAGGSVIHPKYHLTSDSGFADTQTDVANGNHYETPYAQLLPLNHNQNANTRPYRPSEDIYFTQEAFMQPQNSVASRFYQKAVCALNLETAVGRFD